MYTGVDKSEVTAKIEQAGENASQYTFYKTGDTVTAVPFGESAPQGGVLLPEDAPDALPEPAPTQPAEETEATPAGTPTPTETDPIQLEADTPDPSQPLGQFSRDFIQNMRGYQADKFRKPVQKFFGALGGVGRSFQGKSSGFMTDQDKAAYQTRLLNMIADQDAAVQSSLKAALSGQASSLEGLETMYREQSDILQTIRRSKEASAQAAMKEQSADLRQQLDLTIEEKEKGGWQGYSTNESIAKSVSAGVNAITSDDTIFAVDAEGNIGFRSSTDRNSGKAKFANLVLAKMRGTQDADQNALFVDLMNISLSGSGLQSTDQVLSQAGNEFYTTHSAEMAKLLRDAEIAKRKRVMKDEEADQTIKQIQSQQSARVQAYLDKDPDYANAQAKLESLETQINDARKNVGKLSYSLSHDGKRLTPESWQQATQQALQTAAPPPIAAPAEPAAPPPPQAEPEPVEAAPAEAQKVQDGQYEYQEQPDGTIAIFKSGEATPLTVAQPGTEAFTNAKKVIDAKPEPAPAPTAPAVGEGDSPQPSPAALDEAKVPGDEVQGLELAPEGSTPQDVAMHLLNTGGNNSKRFQQQVMASPMFEKFMKDKGLTDPKLGWRSFTSEFRYRSGQQKKMDRRKIDEEILQEPERSSKKDVMGAKVRSFSRRLFAPRDSAGNPTTRWERSFTPKPNPAAEAVSETPTDNNTTESEAKKQQNKPPVGN
jgi:hypothetical protein